VTTKKTQQELPSHIHSTDKTEPYSIPIANGEAKKNNPHEETTEEEDNSAKDDTVDVTAQKTTAEELSEVGDPEDVIKALHYVEAVPITDIEPPNTSDTFDLVPKLSESLVECGLLHPVTITPNVEADLADPPADKYKYKLVAGRARFLATHNNLEKTIPAIIVYGDRPHLASVAAQENLVRRRLTCLDQALLLRDWQSAYEQKYPETMKGGDTTQKGEQNDNLSFCNYAAERTPYNCRTIQRLIRIAKGLAPEAIEVLKLGVDSSAKPAKMADHQSSLEWLVKEFKHDDIKLQKAAVLQSHGNPKELHLVIEKLRREELKKQSYDWADENITLINADFRDVGDKVPNQMIDLILTDPPWRGESVHLGEALGEFADHVLRPGGAIVMMLGQANQLPFLELVRRQLTDDKYAWWEFAYLYKDNAAAVVHSVKVASKWKPIWVAIKKGGNHHDQVIPDLIKETGGGTIIGGGKDKTYHKDGQSTDGFETLMKYLTKPGDLVVDPFVGGGTTAVAALREARRCIGIDIEEDNIKMTRIHLQNEAKELAKSEAISVSDSASSLPTTEVSATVSPTSPVDMQVSDAEQNSVENGDAEAGEAGHKTAA
jgi:16S rRNA G966 N2-methylase RsmD